MLEYKISVHYKANLKYSLLLCKDVVFDVIFQCCKQEIYITTF